MSALASNRRQHKSPKTRPQRRRRRGECKNEAHLRDEKSKKVKRSPYRSFAACFKTKQKNLSLRERKHALDAARLMAVVDKCRRSRRKQQQQQRPRRCPLELVDVRAVTVAVAIAVAVTSNGASKKLARRRVCHRPRRSLSSAATMRQIQDAKSI